ncbi:hypothetical protein STSP2_03163 [Anaerohalosphaera lusitana]|uniref:Uncharacterized protein n=1 Tax=Anaerohalosphaera lusitana TaxID=1936003 RepID=A0A1U9NPV5_9BACT|nr:hypothetical protein [Anaerohalosphaera lusitana]AQT69963.1 hypothetical protein STSP2_03163 [Anaerohalosphaera lusitana]
MTQEELEQQTQSLRDRLDAATDPVEINILNKLIPVNEDPNVYGFYTDVEIDGLLRLRNDYLNEQGQALFDELLENPTIYQPEDIITEIIAEVRYRLTGARIRE